MADTDTLEIQNAKLAKSLTASRAEYKETAAALKAAQAALAQNEALGVNPNAGQLAEYLSAATKAAVASETSKLHSQIAALTAQLNEANAATADISSKLADRTISEEVRQAALASHVRPDAIDGLLQLGHLDLKLIDGIVQTTDGQSVENWLDGKKATAGYLWPVARGAGARGSGDGDLMPSTSNPFLKGAGWNMTAQSQITLADPARAARLQSEAAAMSRQ